MIGQEHIFKADITATEQEDGFSINLSVLNSASVSAIQHMFSAMLSETLQTMAKSAAEAGLQDDILYLTQQFCKRMVEHAQYLFLKEYVEKQPTEIQRAIGVGLVQRLVVESLKDKDGSRTTQSNTATEQ